MVRLPEVALPLGRFLREDVAAICVAAFVLAGSGLPEALCSHREAQKSGLSVLPVPVVSL